jgi:hypothetical protein
MRSLIKLLFLVPITLLVGCAIAPRVETSTTTFYGNGHFNRGTIVVAPIDKDQASSLQFRSVAEYVEQKLALVGYIPTSAEKNPKYTAFITYGIDTGKVTTSSVPIFGQTGGGTTFSSGSVNAGNQFGSYSGTTTTMPTYGMVGSMAVSGSVYKRQVNLDIFENVVGKGPIKVYETKAQSEGSCGNINSILLPIIDGMFKNYPGENGKTQKVTANWNGSC